MTDVRLYPDSGAKADSAGLRMFSGRKSGQSAFGWSSLTAKRKGWSVQEAERWLAPVLNYDPLALAREAAE